MGITVTDVKGLSVRASQDSTLLALRIKRDRLRGRAEIARHFVLLAMSKPARQSVCR
ncbi:MAG TPA: hypothetical protein VJ851_15700 [Jatrophihabitans sp.]|nr:hypothetical protein [Jatrophihabitans sp.]